MKKYNDKKQNPVLFNSFQKRNSRRGAIIIMIVVGLILTTAISGTLIRQSLTNEKQAHLEANRVQATWLVEAGIERATWQLKKNQSYLGETWKILKADLGQDEDGEILISVSGKSQSQEHNQLTITATYPVESKYRVVQSKTILVSINK